MNSTLREVDVADVGVAARRWLYSQIISHEGCIERLSSIQNDAVNTTAQESTLTRMRGELAVWKYLINLLPSPSA